MAAAFHRYIIAPRPAGDGWNMSGTRLPYTLWHTRLDFAIEHAHHLMRDIECGSIWVLDSSGYPIVAETFHGSVPRFLGS